MSVSIWGNTDNTVVLETNNIQSSSFNFGHGADLLVLPGNQADYNLNALNNNNGIYSGQISGSGIVSLTVNNVDAIAFADTIIGDETLYPAKEISSFEYPLDLSAELNDLDGSESLTLTITGLPEGAVLSEGSQKSDGSWSIDVDGNSYTNPDLVMTVPEQAGDFQLQVKATATETNPGSSDETVHTESASAVVSENIILPVPVNHEPTSSDDSVSMLEGAGSLTLTVNDFGDFTDDDNDSLEAVRIETLPDSDVGTLVFDNQAVTQGQELTLEQIGSGKLQFITANDDTDLDSGFEFSVFDGSDWSEQSYSTSINIDAVADAPTVSINIATPQEVYRQITHEGQTIHFSETLGEERGDDNIYDTPDYNYGEASTQSFDFGAEFAGQTVTIELPVQIKGSWNSGNNVYDDNWVVKANGVENVFNSYGSGANYNLNEEHTETITAKLDDEGQLKLEFSASTTQTSEIAIIKGASATVEPIETDEVIGYQYPLDLTAALSDTDGSESLMLMITGLPDGAVLSEGTQNSDGSWSIEVSGHSYTSSDLSVTLPLGSENFGLQVEAIATETSPGSTDTTIHTETASSVAMVDVEMPELATEDLVPLAEGESHELLVKSSDISTNLTFIVDVSSSMSNTDLALSEGAISSIVQQYGAIGDVNINLIQFWGDNAVQTGWQSPGSLKVDLQTDKKGTDPEQGLRLAVDSYDGSQAQADQDIIFYLGDGNPYGLYEDDYEAYLPVWTNFAENTVDSVKVFGVNTRHLDIADDIVSSNESPVYVSDIADFANIVSDIEVEPSVYRVNGELLDNVTGGDGSISIDGIEIGRQIFDATDFANGQTVDIDGQGKLSVDFETGQYRYSVSSDEFSEATSKQFTVIVSDEDGDRTTFHVDINVSLDAANMERASGITLDVDSGVAKTSLNIGLQSEDQSDEDKSFISNDDPVESSTEDTTSSGTVGLMGQSSVSISTANLVSAPVEGLSYETSSGLKGEMESGRFEFDQDDSVNIFAGDQLVASFDAADIGDDALITFDEAGFVVSQDELSLLLADEGFDAAENQLIDDLKVEAEFRSESVEESVPDDTTDPGTTEDSGTTEETETGVKPEVKQEVATDLAASDNTDNDFGALEEDGNDPIVENDLFLFGESQSQGLMDALENGVQQPVSDQGWYGEIEADQSHGDTESFGDLDVDSTVEETGYL
ncbi:vWA domain-containing protein, partial [Oceanospirillum linum]|uniref:vWA domain-containing protein n=1 Tax=Oceanospirillum linum TaxID=966 RepID=UPI0024B92F00